MRRAFHGNGDRFAQVRLMSNSKESTPAGSKSLASALMKLRRESPEMLGRDLTRDEIDKFSKYLDLLAMWQKTARLIGSAEPGWIVEHLILDSLLFLKLLPATASRIIDVGSGAGFPGIPLRVVRADLAVTLLDSRRRRTSFLSTVVRDLELENVRVVNARIEDAAADIPTGFDVAVVRCAGRWAHGGAKSVDLVRAGGVMIVSGPPEPDPSWPVEWVRISGIRGKARLFAITRREMVV